MPAALGIHVCSPQLPSSSISCWHLIFFFHISPPSPTLCEECWTWESSEGDLSSQTHPAYTVHSPRRGAPAIKPQPQPILGLQGVFYHYFYFPPPNVDALAPGQTENEALRKERGNPTGSPSRSLRNRHRCAAALCSEAAGEVCSGSGSTAAREPRQESAEPSPSRPEPTGTSESPSSSPHPWVPPRLRFRVRQTRTFSEAQPTRGGA